MKNRYVLLAIFALIAISCSDSTTEREATSYQGEIVFSESTELEISDISANVKTTINLYEREGDIDMMAINVQASSQEWEFGFSGFEAISPSSDGISIDKKYDIGVDNSDMDTPNGIVLYLSDGAQFYDSSAGVFSITYSQESTTGTFSAMLYKREDMGNERPETFRVEGTFSTDSATVRCFTLSGGDESEDGMTLDEDDASVEGSYPITYPASNDDPFCQQYL